MKRTKRILSLVLAMVMAFALLAMPAMAAGEIMPREPMRCNHCGTIGSFPYRVKGPFVESRQVAGCSKSNFMHKHDFYYELHYYECTNAKCGLPVNTFRVDDHEDCRL